MQISHIIFGFVTLASASGAMAFDCPPAPEGMRDIKAQGYYTDAAKSVVDPVLKKAGAEMVKPLADFNKQVTGMSDIYLDKKDVGAGKCTIVWLDRWAHDGAMLGEMVRVNNDQAEYLRQWAHGAVAIAYFKAKDVATSEQKKQIEAWLKEIGKRNLAYWENPKKSRNNHYYWTGVGIMATAIATGDTAMLKYARGIYEKGVDDIDDDGSMAMEMRREKRAFHYHNFALAPLVIIAEMSRVVGQDLYDYKSHRINLLAELVARGYRDSTWFTKRTGVEQQIGKPNGETGWVEFYFLRASRPELFDDLHKAGPFRDPRLGGDMSLMVRRGLFDAKSNPK